MSVDTRCAIAPWNFDDTKPRGDLVKFRAAETGRKHVIKKTEQFDGFLARDFFRSLNLENKSEGIAVKNRQSRAANSVIVQLGERRKADQAVTEGTDYLSGRAANG